MLKCRLFPQAPPMRKSLPPVRHGNAMTWYGPKQY
jgi:hypothetical protein